MWGNIARRIVTVAIVVIIVVVIIVVVTVVVVAVPGGHVDHSRSKIDGWLGGWLILPDDGFFFDRKKRIASTDARTNNSKLERKS